MVEATPRLDEQLWILESRPFRARMGVLYYCSATGAGSAKLLVFLHLKHTLQADCIGVPKVDDSRQWC